VPCDSVGDVVVGVPANGCRGDSWSHQLLLECVCDSLYSWLQTDRR